MAEHVNFGPPAITVDVEDWPESSFDSSLPVTRRALVNTERVLTILRECRVKATMFILGKMATTFPQLVRDIHAEGHEVASHDWGHHAVFGRSEDEFRATIKRCKDQLEELTGTAVRGYRAPDFSITQASLWGLEVLADLGFEYDSSIFPVRRPRYGIPTWPRHPVQVAVHSGKTIAEVPIGTVRLLNKNWPIGGGGYCRLLPGLVNRYLTRKALVSAPFIFYCHPYEFDPSEFAEIDTAVPWKLRLHQGLGRGRFEARFRRFLATFGGRPIHELLLEPLVLNKTVTLEDWSRIRGWK